ncbi:MAG: helix-turn-helix domain-containing protein [Chloroflexaceae bacterium]|nr:helix-turn-helix domain-containing protein [Chloroflexaceae bacterium]
MSNVGDRLRATRESQGLPLSQVAAEIHIVEQSLAAVEQGEYHRLPNDVVIKGFIRNYAQFLGLSADEMIELYRRERGESDRIQVVPTTRMPRTRSYVFPSFFGIFFVTVFLIGLTYMVLNAQGRVGQPIAIGDSGTPTPAVATPTSLPTLTEEVATQAPIVATGENPAPTQSPPTATARPAGAVATPQPTPTLPAPIVVQVQIVPESQEGSWMRVTADGTVIYEQIMLPAEQQVFLAQRQITIRAGNPTDVQVSVNGLEPEIIGQIPGQPVDWSWPPR